MKTRFFALWTLVLALAACNNDNENLNGDPVAAQFTADIALATPPAEPTWDNGDRIGITDIGNDTQCGNVAFHPEKMGNLRQKKGHLYRRYKDPYFPRLLSVQHGGRYPRSHDRCHGAAEPVCH